jgi:ribosomal protein L33
MKDIVDDKIKTHVDAHVNPLIETVNKQHKTITEQAQTRPKQAAIITTLQTTAKDHTLALKEHSTEVDALYNTIIGLESRLEGQEQYSSRTSLRFHNIKVPVDERGNAKHPVNTDELILNVCNDKLGLDINLHDIGRSHIIGKVKDGKPQVIMRFISYRTRSKVYSNKKSLKNHPDKISITENLTKYRPKIVKKLAELKYNGLLYTYWISDGRIFLKQNTTSREILISNREDILDFIHSTEHDTST